MPREVKLGNRWVGDGHPTYIIAELGINHNGDLEIAKAMIDAAVHAGVDAVKFQKRTPEVCTPPEQQKQMRETPWGYITYLEYRYKVEFGLEEYREIDRYCKEKGIPWFASVWDEPSVDFMEQFDTPAYKIPSAALTDHNLLRYVRRTGRPIILSTGMSTMEQIRRAVDVLGTENLIITHCTSTYPCEPEELNLRMIQTLRNEFPNVPIGYSGHEVGLVPSAVAVALGACLVERHLTLDRAMWGSDQAASVEPGGFERLVKYIRVTEAALGDGIKRVYESEKPSLRKLRRVNDE
ncbi:MAG: N-acetylneuraminate synthase family protein [Anaerolineales bacterium]